MTRPELIRHLLQQNITLMRENLFCYDFMQSVEKTLIALDKNCPKAVLVDHIAAIRADLKMVCDAATARQIAETGRDKPPTADELANIAKTEGQVEVKTYIVELNPMLKQLIRDLLDGKKNHAADSDSNDKSDWSKYYFHPKGNSKADNFGGDLEGEWQDSDEDDNFPPNPFAGSD